MQSGQSLVEAVVASLIVAITIVAGMTTLDATIMGARQVAVQGWAQCMQRGYVEAVTAAPWDAGGGYPASDHVSLSTTSVGAGAERITITVADPRSGGTIARVPAVSVYKAAVLSPTSGAYDPAAISAGCRPLLEGKR